MKPTTDHIEFASILSARTKEGLVEMVLNDHKTQMTLPKAREVLGLLSGAISRPSTPSCGRSSCSLWPSIPSASGESE